MSRISKQVIVMRKSFIVDGKKVTPRKGKYIAQGSHASLGAILGQMEIDVDIKDDYQKRSLYLDHESALYDWLTGSFTKVTLCVETEEELLAVYNKAKEAGLITCLITDSGRTEFNGIPTITCCSILGWSDEVDPITGNLELF
jgi:PTH2 family peptidyl-tRNA hydrolase